MDYTMICIQCQQAQLYSGIDLDKNNKKTPVKIKPFFTGVSCQVSNFILSSTNSTAYLAWRLRLEMGST